MPLYEPYLPARYAAPVFDILAPDVGASVLQLAGLGADKLRHDAVLTYREVERLFAAASAALPGGGLGFLLGQRITVDDHDTLSVVLRQCRTLDTLLRTLARYRKLVTNGFFVLYERDADFGDVVFRPAAALDNNALTTLEEVFAVAFHFDIMRLVGQMPGLEISLSIPAPAHAARYRQLKPTRFHFSASALPEVRCRIPAHLLDRPVLQIAPIVAAPALTTAPHLNEQSAEYAQWVALILREAEGVQPRLGELASMLNISARTLNRFLLAEGTSLRALGSAIRLERAMAMLRQSDTSISQVAYRLGYASPTSFYIAFRKGAGIGPREYRDAS
ncbi:MAG: helix-turn-helix domain-containing protein [Pseudomonadota bacterium]